MKNAHLRFGSLMYVKSTEKTTTSIKLHLDRFIGELLPHPPRQAKAHLLSVIGGDTQIAAISAAVSLGDRFMIEGPEIPPVRVCLERNAQCFKGSLPVPGRRKPLCHLVGLSEELISASRSANTGRLLLAGSEKQFIWASVADTYGIPGIPKWADWFRGELHTHRAIELLLGIGCSPVVIKGAKEQFLDWLSWGVESGAARFPEEAGPTRWPPLDLGRIFVQAIPDNENMQSSA